MTVFATNCVCRKNQAMVGQRITTITNQTFIQNKIKGIRNFLLVKLVEILPRKLIGTFYTKGRLVEDEVKRNPNLGRPCTISPNESSLKGP